MKLPLRQDQSNFRELMEGIRKIVRNLPRLFLVGGELSFMGFLTHALAVCIPFWRVQTFGNITVNEGLWGNHVVTRESCGNYDPNQSTLTTPSGVLIATRVFALLGLITGGFSVVFQLLIGCHEGLRQKRNFVVNFAICFMTAALIMASVVTYQSTATGLSWGWGLGVVAMLLYNAAGSILASILDMSPQAAEDEGLPSLAQINTK